MANEMILKSVEVFDKKELAKKFKSDSYKVYREDVLLTFDRVENKKKGADGFAIELPPSTINELAQELRNDACIVALSEKAEELGFKIGDIVAVHKPHESYQLPKVRIDGEIYSQVPVNLLMGVITDEESKIPTSIKLRGDDTGGFLGDEKMEERLKADRGGAEMTALAGEAGVFPPKK